MGILKFASKASKRIELGEGDFIDVKEDLSKREFNALMAAMPNREITKEDGLTLTEGLEFQKALFETIVTGWSLPEAATLENYLELEQAASKLIDEKLIEHFGTIAPSDDEASKAVTSQGGTPKARAPRR